MSEKNQIVVVLIVALFLGAASLVVIGEAARRLLRFEQRIVAVRPASSP